MSKFFFIFILISVSIFGQKKQFETAIKNGRSSGGFYQATVANDKAVKETDVLEYATKNNYLLRNITYQMVNRFGDKFKGVKSFDFLPVSEIPQVIYETKYRGNVSYKELTAKKKGAVYYWTGTDMFKLFSGFHWSGIITPEGLVDGYGIGYYSSENGKSSSVFSGRFNKGILEGNGTFSTYSYSDDSAFDKSTVYSRSLDLSNTYNDDMAVLTIDGKKGFVGKNMKDGFYPKYSKVIQEFSNGKAIVLNDDNKEIVINKVGNFIAYSDRQIQIDEQRRKEEEERIRIATENEKNRIHEAYNLAINSNDETKLLQFYSQHKSSSYDFAKDYAKTTYNKAIKLNEKNYQPYMDELNYNQGNSLVKMIFTTNDGSPIALKIDDIYNFIDRSHVRESSVSNALSNLANGELNAYGNGEKHFPSIRKPISYMDNAIINAFWYRAGTKSEGSFYYKQSGFTSFKQKIENFAANHYLTVKVSYLGTLDDDIAREQERIASVQRYQQRQCDNCIIDPKKSTMPKVDKDLFGTYEKDGVIVMKNGNEFKWYYSKKGFTVNGPSWLRSSDDGFASWDLMIEDLKQKCSINNRCE